MTLSLLFNDAMTLKQDVSQRTPDEGKPMQRKRGSSKSSRSTKNSNMHNSRTNKIWISSKSYSSNKKQTNGKRGKQLFENNKTAEIRRPSTKISHSKIDKLSTSMKMKTPKTKA